MSDALASSLSCIPLPTNIGSTVHYNYANILCSPNANTKSTLLRDLKSHEKSCDNSSKKPVSSRLLKVIPVKSLMNKKSFMDLRSKVPSLLTRSNTFTRTDNKDSVCQETSFGSNMLDSTKKSTMINKQKYCHSPKNATSGLTNIKPGKNDDKEIGGDKVGIGNKISKSCSNNMDKTYSAKPSKLKLPGNNLKAKNVKNQSLTHLKRSANSKHNSSDNLLETTQVENVDVKMSLDKPLLDNCGKMKLILKQSNLIDKDNISDIYRGNLQGLFKINRNNIQELQRIAIRAKSEIMINELNKDKNVTKHIALKNKHLRNSSVPIKTAQSDLGLSPFLCVEYEEDKATSHDLATSLQDVNRPADLVNTKLFLGLDFAESTLDCSIELVDVSLSSTVISQNAFNDADYNNYLIQTHSPQLLVQQQSKQKQAFQKQNSFEMDESLGILTPDQMKELLISTASNTNNYDEISEKSKSKLVLQQLRIDQTPSPEELPLDSIEVKTDIDTILYQQHHHQKDLTISNLKCTDCASFHTETDTSKTDSINRVSVSKISNSFITSVTSVTSLDTGYQGDGEMSRPGSRGASENSSSTMQAQKGVSRQPSFNLQQSIFMPPTRRQDPMTDSDFFTESDADDLLNRGDRNAHIIDGQLYAGHMLSPIASVQSRMDDSCMESSGVFTDVENRGEEDLAQVRCRNTNHTKEINVDSSPNADIDDGTDSTGTVKSNYECTKYSIKLLQSNEKLTNTFNNTHCTESITDQMFDKNEPLTIQEKRNAQSDKNTTLSKRSSYSSIMDNGVTNQFKNATSLNEAFNKGTTNDDNVLFNCNTQKQKTQSMHGKLQKSFTTSTTTSATSWCEQSLMCVQKVPPVQKITSPRKYASLSSISSQDNLDTIKGLQEAHKSITDCVNVNVKLSKPIGENVNGKTSKFYLKENVKACKNSILTNKCKPRMKFPQKIDKIDHNVLGNSKGNNNKVINTEKSSNSITNSTATSTSTSTATSIIVRKYQLPNKWNSVMNQIERNKTLAKTNYNNVKSKVVARLNMGAELNTGSAHTIPNNNNNNNNNNNHNNIVRRSQTSNKLQVSIDNINRNSTTNNLKLSNNNKWNIKSYNSNGHINSIDIGNSNISSSHTNRLKQFDNSNNKRGRLPEKNPSGKSSQNDINSTNAGPSKPMAKILLRTAKKRDVRNLSISSSNLGPPSKTQQAFNGVTTVRCKVPSPPPPPPPSCMKLTQKRHSSDAKNEHNNISSDTSAVAGTTSPYEDIKSKLSNKKLSGTARCEAPKIKATPGKEHNRILNQSVCSSSTAPFINDGCNQKVVSDLNNMVATKLIDDKYINNNNNDTLIDKLVDDNSPQYTSSIPPTTRLIKNKVYNYNNLIADNNDGKTLEKEDMPNVMASCSEAYQTPNNDSPTELQSSTLALEKVIDSSDHHLYNNRLNSQKSVWDIMGMQHNATNNNTQSKSVEALAVLINYLVCDLDAFACPKLKNENFKVKEQLKNTEVLLKQTRSAFNDLQNQMCEKENFYERRENELHALHRSELEKAYSELTDLRSLTKTQIDELQIKLCAKDSEIKCTLDSYTREMEQTLTEKDELIKAGEERERLLHQKYTVMAQAEQTLREKITSLETSCAGRLQMATARENELNERIKCLSTEIKKLRSNKYGGERDGQDKLHFSPDEMAVLRSGRHSLNESNVTNYQKNANNSMSLTPHNMEICRLQSEADSLHCVLELKQKEISKLIKQNEELLRDAEEKQSLQNKISCLQSKIELLQSELNIKSEKEKGFLRQIDDMQKALNHETVKRTRLSYDNEALQWQLKQRSEQLHIIEGKLSELSSNTDINYVISSQNRPSSSNSNTINSLPDVFQGSPPSSPIVKGVIEKSDSVSWVLEMDDQTPEVAASKVVKRAGPFRSVERIVSARRQLPLAINLSVPSIHSPLNYNTFISELDSSLSQSMPNTDIVPEHSKICAIESKNCSHSKSASNKMGETSSTSISTSTSARKLRRHHSLQNNQQQLSKALTSPCKKATDDSALHILSSHSPTLNLEIDMHEDTEALFKNTLGNKLITCDMSTLNVGEPLDNNATLPKHSSLKCLNIVKQTQEVKESAGEALVSDTNSEDENCSAFSDDAVSLASTTSNTSPSPALNRLIKDIPLSIDEALLIEKIDLPQETTMNLTTWTEDGEPKYSKPSSSL